MTVAATRETVTYTMPVGEARLPPSLIVQDVRDTVAPEASSEVFPTLDSALSKALPPPLPSDVSRPADGHGASRSNPENGPPVDDIQTLARRFGPAPRDV